MVELGEMGESCVGVRMVDLFLGLVMSSEDFLPGELTM